MLTGTVQIDRWHKNTLDKAKIGEHYYSDKAPGTVFVALAPFALSAELSQRAGMDLDDPKQWLLTSWLTCAIALGIPLALGAAALYRWLERRTNPRAAAITTLGVTLGGMPWAYATALWSHSLVFGLICIAIDKLDILGNAQRTTRDLTQAGFCLGLALASEYTAGIVIGGIVAMAVLHHRLSPGPILLGMLGPLALVPAYSWMVMGTPFNLPYSAQASFPEMKTGIYGIQWPKLDVLGWLLVGAKRGLFFWSPFLLLALPGLWRLSGELEPRRFGWLFVPAIATVAAISGRLFDWEAGFCLGPRYLTPILPLIAFAVADVVARHWRTAVVLAMVSIGITGLTTVTDAHIPTLSMFPLWEFVLENVRIANFGHNIVELIGIRPQTWVPAFMAFVFTASAAIMLRCPRHKTQTKGNDNELGESPPVPA